MQALAAAAIVSDRESGSFFSRIILTMPKSGAAQCERIAGTSGYTPTAKQPTMSRIVSEGYRAANKIARDGIVETTGR